MKLDSIRITVEGQNASTAAADGTPVTGNLIPLLHEIRHALASWLQDETTHIIDLQSLPMSDSELARLVQVLGKGEVSARLTLPGHSEIIETTFNGVWLVTHYDEDETPIARFIEICQAPEILKSQTTDATIALHRLDTLLSDAETTV